MLLYTNYSSSNTRSVIRIFRLYVTKIALHATFLIKNLYLLYYFWSKLPFYGIQEFIFLMTVCRGGQAPFLGSPLLSGECSRPPCIPAIYIFLHDVNAKNTIPGGWVHLAHHKQYKIQGTTFTNILHVKYIYVNKRSPKFFEIRVFKYPRSTILVLPQPNIIPHLQI